MASIFFRKIMSVYNNTSKLEEKSFKGIIKDILFIFAFFPTVKCLVTIMDMIYSLDFSFKQANLLDYSFQLVGLFYVIYYIVSKKKISD